MQSISVHYLDDATCAHNPSATQVSDTNLSDSLAFPYPSDPGEHVLKRSATATGVQVFQGQLKLKPINLSMWLNFGSDAINIGAMNWYEESYLDDDAIVEDETPTMMDMIKDVLNQLGSEEYTDAFFASDVHGGSEVGIDAKTY